MRLAVVLLALFYSIWCQAGQRNFPPGITQEYQAKTLHPEYLNQIAPLVKNSIEQGNYPGAVILAGHQGKIIYRGVFGNQQVQPYLFPMQRNTIFDVASLTKVIVTTTAIMQLVEQGTIKLDAPVAHYWPAFADQEKDKITVRQLLTHTSGLPEDIASVELNAILPLDKQMTKPNQWSGKKAALNKITQIKPHAQIGSHFLYSDINFIVLGYLVERVSHERLDHYAYRHIFKPLKMMNSFYKPNEQLKNRIAPTEIMSGELRWGEVHDPTVNLMGGIAGMAGLFSTADDLGKFAESLLSKPIILKTDTIKMMIVPQTPETMAEKRGLGWDIKTSFSCGGTVFSKASFGHTGWTGTSIWIDPDSHTWLVILTSRTHPKPLAVNALKQDRSAIADLIARAVMN